MINKIKSLFSRQSNFIGVDLGTANTLIYKRKSGIVLNEPTMITVNRDNNKVIAIGSESRRMIGKAAYPLETIRPIQDGVIAHYKLTSIMLKTFIKKVIPKGMGSSTVVISLPHGSSEIEVMAVKSTLTEIGLKKHYIVSQPIAAAIGIGIDVRNPVARMVIDIGGGTTQIAVISASGLISAETLKIGGVTFTETISRHIRSIDKISIGEYVAEDIKCTSVDVDHNESPEGEEGNQFTGLDLNTGKATTFEVSKKNISSALEPHIVSILRSVNEVINSSPPEAIPDIIRYGIHLTGGGAMLNGLASRISKETDVDVIISEAPLNAVVMGAGHLVDNLDEYINVFDRF